MNRFIFMVQEYFFKMFKENNHFKRPAMSIVKNFVVISYIQFRIRFLDFILVLNTAISCEMLIFIVEKLTSSTLIDVRLFLSIFFGENIYCVLLNSFLSLYCDCFHVHNHFFSCLYIYFSILYLSKEVRE